MKLLARSVLSSFALAAAVQTAASSADSADAAYAAFQAVAKTQYEWQRLPRTTPEELAAQQAARARSNEAVVQAAGDFLANYPAEPRRWDVMLRLVYSERQFSGPTAAADRLAWTSLRQDYERQILAGTEVPLPVVERVMMSRILTARASVEQEKKLSGRADPAPWRGALDELHRRAPQADLLGAFEGHYAEFLLAEDPAAGEKFLHGLVGAANPKVAQVAQGKLNALAATRGPVDMKFTAADGRAVDLAQLRGKVVIIDFWATWCMPCLQELPNTKAAFAAYRGHGVEMIGISFDHAPKDPAKPQKSDRTREQFLAEAAKLGMDWPQFYDGKGWDCELGRRFNINSIPRVWILNQEGVLVTQHAHGRKIWDLLAELTGHRAAVPPQFVPEKTE